jgi:CheY-like chemotaxis protein
MKKIVIIDDDADLRLTMKTILSSKYEVREAGNAKEGISLVRSYAPDVVLLDVMMESETAGFELARDIKQDKRNKKVKIMMITSIDRKEHLDFKSEAGDAAWLPVDDYVVKPIDPQTLLSKVEKLAASQ